MSSFSSFSNSASSPTGGGGGGYQPPQHHHPPPPVSTPAPHPHHTHGHHPSSTPPPPSTHPPTPSLTWLTPPSPPTPSPSPSNPFAAEAKAAELPSPRTYFSMLEHRQRLWLFGGFGDAKGRFNDLWVYEEGKGWKVEATKGEGPKPIYLHSACMWGGRMVVYGGNVGKDSNDFFTLDLDTLTWTRIPQPQPAAVAPPVNNPFAPPLPPPSTTPSPRYGHASCINNNQLIIVGGCRQNSIYFSDSYAYTFATSSWRRLGDVPIDLAYHSLFSYGGSVYLFGGYNGVKFGEHLYCLDAQSSTWVPVRVTGTIPPPCCGVAISLLGKYVYVFGGYTAAGHTNLLYRIDMSTRVWELLNTNNKPQPRAYLQSAVIQGAMYIFGGYDGTKCVTDFKMLRVAPAGQPPTAPAPPVPYTRPTMPVIQPPTPSIPVSGSSSSVPLNALFAGLNVQQPQNNHHAPAAAQATIASVLREGNIRRAGGVCAEAVRGWQAAPRPEGLGGAHDEPVAAPHTRSHTRSRSLSTRFAHRLCHRRRWSLPLHGVHLVLVLCGPAPAVAGPHRHRPHPRPRAARAGADDAAGTGHAQLRARRRPLPEGAGEAAAAERTDGGGTRTTGPRRAVGAAAIGAGGEGGGEAVHDFVTRTSSTASCSSAATCCAA